jgi:deazaflavin-dependent oxidoreductase (nitroreductase family)
MKRRIVHAFQKYLLNPPLKLAFRRGLVPPGWALLETIGRTTGRPRQTPVGDGRIGETLWVVAEHGTQAGYVRNIQQNPRVRVRVRDGLHTHWRTGSAVTLPDDDPRERQRILGRGRPGRALNALAVRAMGTELLTVRIDLDPASEGSAPR